VKKQPLCCELKPQSSERIQIYFIVILIKMFLLNNYAFENAVGGGWGHAVAQLFEALRYKPIDGG
jgi:hypothetical protein